MDSERLARRIRFAAGKHNNPDMSVVEIVARMADSIEALTTDKQRLDWLDENCTRIADSERYLGKSVYWGGGSKHNIRTAVDAAKAGD